MAVDQTRRLRQLSPRGADSLVGPPLPSHASVGRPSAAIQCCGSAARGVPLRLPNALLTLAQLGGELLAEVFGFEDLAQLQVELPVLWRVRPLLDPLDCLLLGGHL